MTLTLILTRHAKSSWDDPSLDDHDRPLNARGREAAGKIGAWLASRGLTPGAVLSSSARRTRETWEIMAPHLDADPELHWEQSLFHAGPNAMLKALRGAPGADCVLMLGHNPGIAAFAESLVSKPPDHGRFFDYPTAATTVIEFDLPSWGDVDWRKGRAVAFAIPRDLEG